jgi:NADPH-dependent curcumin reductase CurA
MNRTIHLKSRPHGEPTLADFETRDEPVPEPGPSQLLYRTTHLSLDPYLRGRMNEGKSYIEPFALGAPIVSGFVGQVVRSNLPAYAPGDLVTGMGPWSHHGLSDGRGLAKLPRDTPPSAALGVLGMPGLTAYVGLIDIGRVKPGETVVVSAASGAVGGVVVQLAKLRDCRVIGVAGRADKCDYVTKELGADACIDYHASDVAAELRRLCPKGIDVYFDNVGGAVLDAVLKNLRDHARIALCGMISEYNAETSPPGPNLRPLLANKALIQGFIVGEHLQRRQAFLEELVPLVRSGKVKHKEDVTKGLDNAPRGLIGLLRGENFGKALVEL